ncbi:MAG: ATP-dependent helicase HrpB [Myxococcales bacterium]
MPAETLPIDQALPGIVDALRDGSAVVIEAPPGAGKTTRVPPALLDLVPGEVLVLEPRRIAARAAARRVAAERGEKLGESVGYQVRFEDVSGPRTKVRFLTEAILTRRLLRDPSLAGVGAVVLDEFHERHLHGDLALSLLARLVRSGRPDLKLVVMSATLETAPVAHFLGCPVVKSEGRRFPVDIEHLERPDDRRLPEQVAAAVRRATVPGTRGDVLVFLPGAGEIRAAAQELGELAAARDLLVTPLHGDLPSEEQDRALAPAPRRKVILATNVAETSVTVPGVTIVVDSGLFRLATHSPWSGLPSLSVAKVSRASAEQRAGRAGRLEPGRAIRLYTRAEYESRPPFHPPEVQRADLAEMSLDLAAAGIDPAALDWLDPPSPQALGSAQELLRRLGLIDDEGRATDLGRRCADMPLHPRLSRLALEAARRGAPREGSLAAAILGEREARLARPAPTGRSDVLELLDTAQIRPGSRLHRARAQVERHLGRAKEAATRDAREEAVCIAVLAAFPDRVARRRVAGGAEVVFAGGGSATMARESGVRDAELLVAVDAEERRTTRASVLVRLASAIEPEWLLDLFADDLMESVEVVWDAARERVAVVARLSYQGLVLEESRKPPGPEHAGEAARLLASHATPELLLEPDALASLRGRVEAVATVAPEHGLRRIEDTDVRAALESLCHGLSSLEDLRGADLKSAILERAGPGAAALLDRLAPESVPLPSGRRVRVEYGPGQPPALRSRLQDFFGMKRGPAIVQGRLPLVLHLLAPNGRAQQVTQDLAGFWERHYPAVRRELMRRYPKHAWPEDGATATPPAPRRGHT